MQGIRIGIMLSPGTGFVGHDGPPLFVVAISPAPSGAVGGKGITGSGILLYPMMAAAHVVPTFMGKGLKDIIA